MSLFKTSAIFPACSALQLISPPAATYPRTPRCLSTRDSRYQQQRYGRTSQTYATIAGSDDSPKSSDASWPETPAGQSCPSPYQIFAIAKDAPYSKVRFYELVKLYHPDKTTCSLEAKEPGRPLSAATRLDRYRLIVAAHEILSDPVKRDAYDRYGAGWAGNAEISKFSPGSARHGSSGPFTSWQEKSNQGWDSSIWSNATWEDWERWRRKQDYSGSEKKAQGPLYLQNSTFVSIIMVIAGIGSAMNYNRAEAEGGRFLAARDAVHDQASKDLRRVRQSIEQRPKDERIDWFMRNREAALSGYGVDELRDERVRHMLPPPQNCSTAERTPKEP